ncbi:TonB-dependent receptor [uncultured Maricaulis sp.]|uniref:TonB-dependent receptor n=1 Tax=uncultured Maricaulis sp. TaxID=174710 RepID=UPI002616A5CB|nr:TonB-dependent receptor [uncultured Maricaulis sp.]
MTRIQSARRHSLRALLASTVACIAAAPALAQDEAMDEDVIVVTAQQRAQSSQDVPISLQVMDSEFISSVAADDMGDLDAFVPGLDVSNGSPTQPRYSIRGITTSDFGVGTDPAVGIYVDGIYAARSGASLLAFNDIERIEVLKGPQGTLFGRNSAAGAVSIITREPSDELEGRVAVRLGSHNRVRTEAMINIPITDTLAVRANFLDNSADGWLTDAVTGEDYRREDASADRITVRWDATPSTQILLRHSRDSIDQDARPAIGIVDLPAAPGTPPLPVDTDAYLNPFNAPLRNDVVFNREARDLAETTLTIRQDIGEMTLTSLTSYREFDTMNREDEDGTNRIDTYFDTSNVESNEAFYQEFRLAGTSGPVDWLIGASYYDETAIQASETFTFTDTVNTVLGNIGAGTPFTDLEYGLLVPNGLPFSMLGHSWSEIMSNEGEFTARAVYADMIWSATDRLNISLGLRYTEDEKTFQWTNGPRVANSLDQTLAALDNAGILGLAGASPNDFLFDFVFDLSPLAGVACDNGVNVAEGVACIMEDSWNNLSPRVVVDYQLTENVMVYGSFSEGYKAGGYNSVEVGSRFENETVTSWEVGFKSDFLNPDLIFNMSAFSYVYEGKQSIRLVVPTGGGVPQYLVQTSDDEAIGVDMELDWQTTDALRLYGNAQWIDSTHKRRMDSNGTDLSGEPTGEPFWNVAFGGEFVIDYANGSDLTLQANHAWRGEGRCNSQSTLQGTCGGYPAFALGEARNRTDLRARWTAPNGDLTVSAFVNNVFDNQYVEGVNNITASTLGTAFASISTPRVWGVEFGYDF